MVDDKFLNYYNQELIYLRELGEEFADQHPKIASRLQMGSDGVGDAHTEHMIQSFAFLTARLSQKLDDDFDEISTALLSNMYPHYLSPIPSMSTVQFKAGEGLTGAYTLPRHTALESSAEYGEVCQFMTAYDVEVLPLCVTGIKFLGLPLELPAGLPEPDKIAGAIELQLQTDKDLSLSELKLEQLRFFIGDAETSIVSALYELLANQLVGLGVANTAQSAQMSWLTPQHWTPTGFEREQSLLIYPSHTLASYQLLTEFFVYPEKYFYFDCSGLESLTDSFTGNTLVLTLFLKHYDTTVAKRLNVDAFKLACTPIVNLFRQHAEPLRLDHSQAEYPMVADRRRRDAIEIYSIIEMDAVDEEGQSMPLLPLYGIHHPHHDAKAAQYYWFASRVAAKSSTMPSYLKVAFSDINYEELIDKDYVINAEVWCSNGYLPATLPFSKDEPKLQLYLKPMMRLLMSVV